MRTKIDSMYLPPAQSIVNVGKAEKSQHNENPNHDHQAKGEHEQGVVTVQIGAVCGQKAGHCPVMKARFLELGIEMNEAVRVKDDNAGDNQSTDLNESQ